MASVAGTRADDAAGFVQLSCTPELGLFSVRRFQVQNIPESGPYLIDGWKPVVKAGCTACVRSTPNDGDDKQECMGRVPC
jgi:hypothetical protein